MIKTYLHFVDLGNPLQETIFCELSDFFFDVPDLLEAFEKAVAAARKDGVECANWDIPKKYLKAEGLRLTKLPCTDIQTECLGPERPITLAVCYDCQYNCGGYCLQGADHVNGNEFKDCVCGTDDYFIAHDDWGQIADEPIMTELSPKETVEFILHSTDEYYAGLKQSIEEFIEEYTDSEGKMPDPDHYEFIVDKCD